MHSTRRTPVVALTIVMGLAAPAARAQSFAGLGFLPGGTESRATRVSRDGAVFSGCP
jgi:hypothetical protein